MAKTTYVYNEKCYSTFEDACQACYENNPALNDDNAPDYYANNIQEIENISEDECFHNDVKIHSELYSCSTLYDPAEYIYTATCNFCGMEMDGDDVPEGATEHDDW